MDYSIEVQQHVTVDIMVVHFIGEETSSERGGDFPKDVQQIGESSLILLLVTARVL